MLIKNLLLGIVLVISAVAAVEITEDTVVSGTINLGIGQITIDPNV